MNDSTELPKKVKRRVKLKIVQHPKKELSYAIENDFGVICGGKIRAFIPNDKMSNLTYPTIFKSRKLAEMHLDSNRQEMELYEKYSTDILNAEVNK